MKDSILIQEPCLRHYVIKFRVKEVSDLFSSRLLKWKITLSKPSNQILIARKTFEHCCLYRQKGAFFLCVLVELNPIYRKLYVFFFFSKLQRSIFIQLKKDPFVNKLK